MAHGALIGIMHEIVDQKMSPRDAILTVARMFGPCVSLRETPLGPAPRKLTTTSRTKPSHYTVKLKEAEKELQRLKKLTPTQALAAGVKERAAKIERANKRLQEIKDQNLYIQGLIAKAEAWVPPTDEHAAVKIKALEWFRESIEETNYAELEVQNLTALSVTDHFEKIMSNAIWEVEYYAKEKKAERVAESHVNPNKWLRELHDSLPKK